MLAARSPENRENGSGQGPVLGEITQFQGKNHLYTIKTHRSNREVFTEMPQFQIEIDQATNLYLAVYPNRERELSKVRFKKGLGHPRTILEFARDESDDLVGMGIFPKFVIDGEAVVYSSRAILPGHKGEGLGTHMMTRAILLHYGEVTKGHRPLNWLEFMSMNPLSVFTTERLPFVKESYPFGGHHYNENSRAKLIMLGIHREVMMNSRGIETDTGVSRNELVEIGMNDTFRPDRGHQRLWAIFQEMVLPPPLGVGMNREAGDEAYCTFVLDQAKLAEAYATMIANR